LPNHLAFPSALKPAPLADNVVCELVVWQRRSWDGWVAHRSTSGNNGGADRLLLDRLLPLDVLIPDRTCPGSWRL